MTKRKIPPVDTKHYAASGGMSVFPSLDGKEVLIELHHCSIFASKDEVRALVVKLMSAGHKQWGLDWSDPIEAWLEAKR